MPFSGDLAGQVAGGQLHCIQPDHLVSPRLVVDPQRDVAIWRWDLRGEAFGSDAPAEDPDQDGVALRFDLRFPGQRHDPVSGVNYNYFRDYEPATGRYLQSDPIGLEGGWSTYGYVGGDPMGVFDPFGLVGYVCRKGSAVGIAIPINFQGATASQVSHIKSAIESSWSGCFGSFHVKTVVMPIAKWDHGNSNGIAVVLADRASWVHNVWRNEGVWYFPGQWGASTFSHEAGHLLGLPDNGPGVMGLDLNVPVDEQNIRDILSPDNRWIRNVCPQG